MVCCARAGARGGHLWNPTRCSASRGPGKASTDPRGSSGKALFVPASDVERLRAYLSEQDAANDARDAVADLPWFERAREHRLPIALGRTSAVYGMGLNGSANGRAPHSNGAAEKSADAGKNGASHNARPARRAEFMSVGQLLSEPEDEQSYVVEGMLGGGSTALVSAKPKVGKTTLLLFLALCVVRGLQFFGRRVKRGAVLYVALEGNKKEWKRVANAMGFAPDDLFFIYVGQAPQDAIAWLRENAAKYNPSLIIVDTFQRFARLKNISDYAEVTNATEPLVEIARESDAVLLCAVHAKKQNKDGDDGDAVLGSTGLFGAVDTLISLKKTMNGSRVMSTEQRYGDNMPETVLALDPETKRLSLSGERADVDRIVIEQRILSALAESPDLTEPALLAEVGGRTETAKAALKALLKNGRISRSGEGVRGDPYKYRLVPTSMQGWSHVPPAVAA
jgi:hypothetical protein